MPSSMESAAIIPRARAVRQEKLGDVPIIQVALNGGIGDVARL